VTDAQPETPSMSIPDVSAEPCELVETPPRSGGGVFGAHPVMFAGGCCGDPGDCDEECR